MHVVDFPKQLLVVLFLLAAEFVHALALFAEALFVDLGPAQDKRQHDEQAFPGLRFCWNSRASYRSGKVIKFVSCN